LVCARADSELRFELRRAQEPLRDGEFDFVALIDVVHHPPPAANEDAGGRASARVREGGLFLYKDMCKRPSWRARANRLHDLVSYRQWIHYVSIESAESWIRDEGLKRTDVQRVNLFFYGHDLRVSVGKL